MTEARGARRIHRRPSGEPPPLPRAPEWTRWLWIAAVVIVVGVALAVAVATGSVAEDVDKAIRDAFAGAGGTFVNSVAKAFWLLALPGVVYGLRVAAVVVMLINKRIRHMVVFLGTLVVADWIAVRLIAVALEDPSLNLRNDPNARPLLVITGLVATLIGMAFTLAPSGSARRAAWVSAGVVSGLVVLSGLVLEKGSALGMIYGAVLGATMVPFAFAWLAPEGSFPVSYKRGGNAAHLDLSGARAEAVKKAVADQVGLTVTEVEPFGLEGSGGSSPLRMTLEDGVHLFGKIYSTSHLRADRWYKIGRSIMYGKMEDEVAFGSVLRLAAWEDYSLRVLRDSGIGVATTYGVVELTPGREYMLVTEMFANAKNLGDSEIDDTIIDEGVQLIRSLWDAGIAHRDIKPANMLVVGGHLQLVDVSNVELRPTPWRQAIDLANMLLTLALQSDPDRVYERATQVFTPDEIAEALASAQGMAIPTQLSARLKADPRPVMQRLKELAPTRTPIPIQRWSARRLTLAGGASLGVLVTVSLFFDSLRVGL